PPGWCCRRPPSGPSRRVLCAALMVYDPDMPASQRFSLAPLGLDLNLTEPAVPAPGQKGSRYVDGHVIFPDFVPLYDALGGIRQVGKPLTEVHYNPNTKRYEQYFSNLGFYRVEGDSSGSIRLLSYGAWKCDSACRQDSNGNAAINAHPQIESLFTGTVARLGVDFTGFSLTDAYVAADGKMEQVFENVVLAAQGEKVALRSIPEKLGLFPDPLKVNNNDALFGFYSIQGKKGYNVLQAFITYIDQHGSYTVSGAPIGELSRLNDQVYRQCFVNLCLDYDQSASSPVRPAPLGYNYKDLTVQPTPNPSALAAKPARQTDPASARPQEQPALPTPEPAQPVDPNPPAAAPQPDAAAQPAAVGVSPSAAETNPPQTNPAVDPAQIALDSEISVQVWETYPMVASNQAQEIGVSVLQDNNAVANLSPVLVVSWPDGSQKPFVFPPTGGDGQSHLNVPPIAASNGTLVPYQVCVATPAGAKFCVKDSFLIWNP
ncbi:MAG TPA: hypothetical protein VF498_18525, partial [Anaerolineales bacterium]